MKTILLLCVLCSSAFSCLAQSDTTGNKPKRKAMDLINIHLVHGVNFIKDDSLRAQHDVSAAYFFGIGFQLTSKDNSFSFNYDFYRSRHLTNDNTDTLIINQLIPAFSFQLFHNESFSFRAKTGPIIAIITDDINEIDGAAAGLKTGISLEGRLMTNLSAHLDFDYDLMRRHGRDYDLAETERGYLSLGTKCSIKSAPSLLAWHSSLPEPTILSIRVFTYG